MLQSTSVRKITRPAFVVFLISILLAAPVLSGELLRTAGDKVAGEYVVVLNDGYLAAEVAETLSGTYGGRVEVVWEHALNGALFVDLTETQAEALAANPMVAWVEENAIGEGSATQTNPPWGLDRIDQRNLPLDNSYTYDFDGTGVHAYVLDSGIRPTHNDFGSRASADFDSIGDGQNGIDCHGHGTHVAGTLGGSTYGVAKNVRIHAVRVLDCNNQGSAAQIISGVDWVTANATQPAVANMSIQFVNGNSSVDAAVNDSVASGIFYAVAAGNSSKDACGVSPARAANAYTVAATDSADNRAGFSNFGTCVDIFAPGVSILSAGHTGNSATATMSGTSMASPHVAGVAALILDQHPTWNEAQIEAEIDARATTGVVGNRGAGSPNALLYSLSTAVPPTPAFLDVHLEYCNGLNTMDWASSAGATYYELYGSTSSSFSWQYLEYSGSGTFDTVNVSSTTYFRVRACNASGCSGYRNGDQPAQYFSGCF